MGRVLLGKTAMKWVTADTHFYHERMIGLSGRPYQTVFEMNNALIRNWNKLVQQGDDVYHLGDFSFGSRPGIEELRGALNGRIYLIRGNHDRKIKGTLAKLFEWVKDYYEIKEYKQRVILCHYPFMSWRSAHKGSIHAHGHSHGNLKEDRLVPRMDVGVDCHDYKPVALDWVREVLGQRTFSGVDHHEKDTCGTE